MIKLFGRYHFVKDTGVPVDYPPKACEELVANRLNIVTLTEALDDGARIIGRMAAEHQKEQEEGQIDWSWPKRAPEHTDVDL